MSKQAILKFLCAGVLAVATLGCSKKPAPADKSEPPIGKPAATAPTPTAPTPTAPTPSAPPTADGSAKAKEIFGQRCTPCHGPAGAGDGPASASLNPHPRNFTDKEWQKSVTDEHIEQIIKFGGAAVGKSPAMPGNPDLTDPAVITGLRALIRSFGA